MNKLRRNINNFYKTYGENDRFTKSDMYNLDALMSAYESLWFALDENGDIMTIEEYQWVSALYGELGDYIAELPEPTYHWQSMTMGNIVESFAEVICQVWDSLVHYHTIDIKWHYCRKGY
jgi:hypothetical protein